MLNLEKIGQYITKLRGDLNMTQQELAETLFVTHQAVSKWENGKSVPSIEIMVEITKVFKISVDDLLCVKDDEKANFQTMLKVYPRSYVLEKLIKGKLKNVKLYEVMYLLSKDERDIVLSQIINKFIDVDILNLWPYLNQKERFRILKAITTNKLSFSIYELSHMLTKAEQTRFLKKKNIFYKEEKQ